MNLVIYEDDHLLILNKPSGIPSAPIRSSETQTAVHFALARTSSLIGVGREHKRALEPGLIHRLDTGTSGLLVFAKTQSEFDRLIAAWKTEQVQKIYRAWVETESPLPEGRLCLNSPLAHDARSAKKMIALNTLAHPIAQSIPKKIANRIRGKPLRAVTWILEIRSCVERVPDSTRRADLEIQIETGVMHQIRCHLAASGWPILGDVLYRGAPSERLWLHAWRLQLPLKNKKMLTVEAPLPENWCKQMI